MNQLLPMNFLFKGKQPKVTCLKNVYCIYGSNQAGVVAACLSILTTLWQTKQFSFNSIGCFTTHMTQCFRNNKHHGELDIYISYYIHLYIQCIYQKKTKNKLSWSTTPPKNIGSLETYPWLPDASIAVEASLALVSDLGRSRAASLTTWFTSP